jgi:hypothetical protein
MQQPPISKLIKIAAEICEQYADIVADRVCQDLPDQIVEVVDRLTPEEKQWIAYWYEQENSNGEDYDPAIDLSHDGMVMGYAIANLLQKLATNSPPFASPIAAKINPSLLAHDR